MLTFWDDRMTLGTNYAFNNQMLNKKQYKQFIMRR